MSQVVSLVDAVQGEGTPLPSGQCYGLAYHNALIFDTENTLMSSLRVLTDQQLCSTKSQEMTPATMMCYVL